MHLNLKPALLKQSVPAAQAFKHWVSSHLYEQKRILISKLMSEEKKSLGQKDGETHKFNLSFIS